MIFHIAHDIIAKIFLPMYTLHRRLLYSVYAVSILSDMHKRNISRENEPYYIVQKLIATPESFRQYQIYLISCNE